MCFIRHAKPQRYYYLYYRNIVVVVHSLNSKMTIDITGWFGFREHEWQMKPICALNSLWHTEQEIPL